MMGGELFHNDNSLVRRMSNVTTIFTEVVMRHTIMHWNLSHDVGEETFDTVKLAVKFSSPVTAELVRFESCGLFFS